jgi:hypothetical protein
VSSLLIADYHILVTSLTVFLPSDVAYDRSLHNLKTRPMIIPPALSHKAREEAVADFYASVRTNVLLLWVLSNVSCPYGALLTEGELMACSLSGSARLDYP